MKSIGGTDSSKKAEKAAAMVQNENEKAAEKIDFSKVKIEPIFEEAVDFDTFAKSDFRATWAWQR